MALTILAIALLVAICTICYVSIQRAKMERACKHNFQRASTERDVTFGTVSKYVCCNCGRVVST